MERVLWPLSFFVFVLSAIDDDSLHRFAVAFYDVPLAIAKALTEDDTEGLLEVLMNLVDVFAVLSTERIGEVRR